MNNLQQLATAVTKRDEQRMTLARYKNTLNQLTNGERLAEKAEESAKANLIQLTQEKVRTGVDGGAKAARATYSQAMLDLQIATTEREAAEQVCKQAEQELDRLTKSAHRAGIDVAKATATAEQSGLLVAARRYGLALARHRALIRYARAASSDSGVISDPIPEINSLNPLKLELDALVSGEGLDPVSVTERDMLDAKPATGVMQIGAQKL
jgi:hypothetical protein